VQELEVNVAATILIGPAVAVADGVTPVENLALGTADHAELMKHNGTTFVDLTSDSRAFTHKEGGWYTLVLGTGDIDTEGRLTVLIMDTSLSLPIWKDFMVVSQAYWASKYDAKDSGYMDVDIKAVGGTATPHTSGKLHVLNGDGAAITAAGPTKTQMDNGHGLLATLAIQHDADYGDRIYFDEDTGVAGTTHPIGTAHDPSDVIADIISMCTTRNIRKIHVHGALTLAAQMEHYAFFGERHEELGDFVDLGGQDVDGSYFTGLLIKGAQAGAGFINIEDCIVYTLTNFTGMITNSAFYSSTCSLEDTGYSDIDSCYSIYGAVTLTVQAPTRASIKDWKGNLILTAQDGGVMFLRDFVGTLEIDAMTSGTLSVYANGADITINADCTGGTINLYGHGNLTGAGGGVTINNYLIDTKIDTAQGTLTKLEDTLEDDAGTYRFTENALEEAPSGAEAIVAAVWDEPIADHDTEGSTGEALAAATEITLEED